MNKSDISNQNKVCVHCGEPVLHTEINDDEGRSFCCTGCAAVYKMLSVKGWDMYYHLARLQKANPPRAGKKQNYENFLKNTDSPSFLQSNGTWNGNIHSISLKSGSIVCSACGWLLEKVYSEIPGIVFYSVDFIRGEVKISYDSTIISLKKILEKSYSIGYPLLLSEYSDQNPDSVIDPLLKRIIISGACFMNIMIFAAAGYSGLFSGISADWSNFFNWFSLVLSLPVVFYCATPFYNKTWNGLRQKIFHMDATISLGIMITFSVSVWATFQEIPHTYFDSVSGLVFFLLTGRWGVQKFEQNLVIKDKWFENLKKAKVNIIKNEQIHYIDIKDVSPGDLIVSSADEYLPVDGVLESKEAWIDTSLLTGESRPMSFASGDLLYSGYKNLDRDMVLRVSKSFTSSRAAELNENLNKLKEERDLKRDWSEKIAPWFSAVALLLALAAFGYHFQFGLSRAVLVMASVLIIACPCALALAVPLSRSLGLKRAVEAGLFIKNSQILHEVPLINSVIFDKTGTLTYSQRIIKKWKWLNNDRGSHALLLPQIKKLCRQTIHPVARTILRSLDDTEAFDGSFINYKEIIHFGIMAELKDSGEKILICRWFNDPNEENIKEILAEHGIRNEPELKGNGEEMPDTCIYVNGKLEAVIYLTEENKPSVKDLINWLSRKKIETWLLSGDNTEKVEKFAETVGFTNWKAQMSPEQKQNHIQDLKTSGKKIMAVGDGFNDSLLLGESDVGIIVHGGVKELTDQTDILFINDDFNNIKRLFQISSSVIFSIRNCYLVSLGYNAVAITMAMAGKITPLAAAIFMPLSTLSVCLTAYFSVKGKS